MAVNNTLVLFLSCQIKILLSLISTQSQGGGVGVIPGCVIIERVSLNSQQTFNWDLVVVPLAGPGGAWPPCPQDFFQNHAVFRQF